MSLIKCNPNRSTAGFGHDMFKLFDALENSLGFPFVNDSLAGNDTVSWSPRSDIFETENEYKLQMDLPGLKKEDVKITFQNRQISISGERSTVNSEDKGTYHRSERRFGKFYRAFTLPEGIKESAIEAEFKDGQLTVTIPKAEEVKPKQVEISIK